MQTFILITIVVIATIHLMMATVLSLYSRYKVQYLSLAWIMGIFGAMCCIAIPFVPLLRFDRIGLLHPFMLLALVVTSFLQGIYPLSIPMPGYLQWWRMWKYASPAILLIILYVVSLLLGSRPAIIRSYAELADCWWGIDMLFRLAGFGLSIYYVVNMLRLPHLLTKGAEIPRYLKGYTTVMGLNLVFYVVVTAVFNVTLLMVYFYLFCVLNMYLFYRTLETMAIHLPKPEIVKVDEAPTEVVIVEAEREDFNEANRRRFERVEYFMQHGCEWQDNTFGRDRLCEATGINRHLLLQCLRSQGFNNCHDYVNSYRISALKRGVADGTISTVNDCVVVGFGSAKTARTCFERMEGEKLDEFLKRRGGR
ncbi:MAG: hypothetical protein LUC45_03310 [Paraprevotella sp.]|nr:hypothetical protein [Paraprevotella sp.]